MKNIFVAVQCETIEGKFEAHVVTVPENYNLLHVLNGIGGIISANVFETKKLAKEVCKAWNQGFLDNGNYIFDRLYD